jgi:hypothetical protein
MVVNHRSEGKDRVGNSAEADTDVAEVKKNRRSRKTGTAVFVNRFFGPTTR